MVNEQTTIQRILPEDYEAKSNVRRIYQSIKTAWNCADGKMSNDPTDFTEGLWGQKAMSRGDLSGYQYGVELYRW